MTFTLQGPLARESDSQPNPFTDFAFTLILRHESGSPEYLIPGYFAADGSAGESSASAGDRWRAHFAPDKPGHWRYRISFLHGHHAALGGANPQPLAPWDGLSGRLRVGPSNKHWPDLRFRGRLDYVRRHHLRFAGTGEYFLKAGPDAPETLLAYADFDGTEPGRSRAARPGEAAPAAFLHAYAPHLRDWRPGDPVWKSSKGRSLIGALNYLASAGMNTISFLPYNAGGDGDNVWPFTSRAEKLHYDCSKLDQWGLVFDHAAARGLHLHFKLQENEIDDQRRGADRKPGLVPESLDGGALGIERKLYLRELIARFGHLLALTWNLGEENTQSSDEQRQMARYIHDLDPYKHPIVLHTFPHQQEEVYGPLLGGQSEVNGASLQNGWDQTHARTVQWLETSAKAGKPWVIAQDEQNPASLGVPPDPGYQDHSGMARDNNQSYSLHEIRKYCLWGNLMAGGAGVEYYFGYQLPQNDLECEDFRGRERSWAYCKVALDFMRRYRIPFWKMSSADPLAGNSGKHNSRYCFALPNELYLVYLPEGGEAQLDLAGARGRFQVRWFNPRLGGPLVDGRIQAVEGGGQRSLGLPPRAESEDWLVVVSRRKLR